jgi:hypothetical protein
MTGGIFFYVSSTTSNDNPITKLPGKFYVVFEKPMDGARFEIDDQPLSQDRIKQIKPNRILILFPEGGRHTLGIHKTGFISIKRPLALNQGEEQETPPLHMRPAIGAVRLLVTPHSKDAAVFIGEKRQQLPLPGPYRSTAGLHEVKVFLQGHKPWVERINIPVGRIVTRKISLEKTKASLIVSCRDGGQARVFINGRNRGLTPYNDKNLNPFSTYKLRITPTKYKKTYNQEISFPLSPHKQIYVDCLKPKDEDLGSIKLLAIPKAKVWINNKYLGFTPLSRVSLPPGKHQFRFINTKTKQQFNTTLSINKGSNPDFIVNKWEK